MPLVSVIMPSYNHMLFLPEAVESVLNQTFRDLELIIIDDESQDLSPDVAMKYSLQDERIRTFFHDTNQGISDTLNEGLLAATGKYIAFIASDDVWAPEKLERQLEILETDDNLVVWTEGLLIDENGTSTGVTFTQMNHSSGRQKSGYIFEDLLHGNHILGSSMIFKKENLKGIHFDVRFKYLNDFQFNVDMARLYRFRFIQESLVQYRVHRGNTVTMHYEGHILDYPKVGLYFLERYGHDIPDAIKIAIFSNTVNHLQNLIMQQKAIINEQKEPLNVPGEGIRPLFCRFICLLITGKLRLHDVTQKLQSLFQRQSVSPPYRPSLTEDRTTVPSGMATVNQVGKQ
jgi:glycosyltransferase involved in cell wall biosynthesis